MKSVAVLTRLRDGDKLHQQVVDGRRQWWFEAPFQDVPDTVVKAIRASGEFALTEAGDSLFGLPENSQTWGGGVVVSDRTPCINPRCRRTADAAKFPGEMICGKCFRALPAALRAEFRLAWREYRKWNKRYLRTSDEIKKARMSPIVGRWAFRIDSSWINIRSTFITPENPEGLDAFLEEAGL